MKHMAVDQRVVYMGPIQQTTKSTTFPCLTRTVAHGPLGARNIDLPPYVGNRLVNNMAKREERPWKKGTHFCL